MKMSLIVHRSGEWGFFVRMVIKNFPLILICSRSKVQMNNERMDHPQPTRIFSSCAWKPDSYLRSWADMQWKNYGCMHGRARESVRVLGKAPTNDDQSSVPISPHRKRRKVACVRRGGEAREKRSHNSHFFGKNGPTRAGLMGWALCLPSSITDIHQI